MPVNLANVATVARNAAVLEMQGLELEVMYQLTEAWFVRATYGYLDAIDDLSATITYSRAEGRYSVTAFGRNMTDERAAARPYIGGLTQAVAWNEPATYALELGLSF